MFLKQWNSCNICLVCITKPILRSTCLLLFITANCKHNTSHPYLESFEIEKPHTMALVFYILIFLMGFLLNITLLESTCMKTEADCLVLLSDSIIIFTGIWITTDCLFKMHIWLGELNKWTQILEELLKEKALFKQLKKFSTECYRRSILTISEISFQFLLLAVICVLSVSRKGASFITLEISLLFISISQACLFTVIMTITYVIKEIVNIIGIRFCQQLESGGYLKVSIKNYRNHLWSTSYTWRNVNETMKSSAAICLICFIAIIVLNIYLLIIVSTDRSPENIFISCYRVSSTSLFLVCTVVALDQEKMVSIKIIKQNIWMP